MQEITFITGNDNKAKQVSQILGFDVNHKKLDLIEVQSLDLDVIVTQKAMDAYEAIKTPVLVEDISLKYNALGNLPGPFVKWFQKEIGNKGLCRLINHYKKDRSAVVEIAYCLFDGKKPVVFRGSVKGKIAAYPRGNKGFGWDPIFIQEGYNKTRGEMTEKERVESSVRNIALKKLLKHLSAQ